MLIFKLLTIIASKVHAQAGSQWGSAILPKFDMVFSTKVITHYIPTSDKFSSEGILLIDHYPEKYQANDYILSRMLLCHQLSNEYLFAHVFENLFF